MSISVPAGLFAHRNASFHTFSFAVTSVDSNAFFSAAQRSKDNACLCSLCLHCMCVLECVHVVGSESGVGLQSKSAGAHLLL